MSLATDLRARLAVAEETDGPVRLTPNEAARVCSAIDALNAIANLATTEPRSDRDRLRDRTAALGLARGALNSLASTPRAVVFPDEKATGSP